MLTLPQQDHTPGKSFHNLILFFSHHNESSFWFQFFCGVTSEQRQNGDYITKLCRRPATESTENELHNKPHEKTHNDILVDPVCPQCDTSGQRSSDAKQFLRPSECREETHAVGHGNYSPPVAETTHVSSVDNSVLLSNRRTSSNVATVVTNHRSENAGDRLSVSTDVAVKAHGRTRTYRVPGPLHDPLWFVDSDAMLPSRPAMHWSECLEGAYLWAIALLGGVTNAAVLATCACSRRRLRPLHVLIASLAAADLLVSCVYVPTYTYLLVDVPASRVTDSDRRVCRFARAVFVLASSASLSIKDLIAIYFRLMIGSRRWRHRIFRHTPLLALLAWLLNAAVVFAPCVAGFPHVDLYPNAFICGQPSNDTQTQWWIQTEQSYYPTAVLLYYLVVLAVHLLQVGVAICLQAAVNLSSACELGVCRQLSRTRELCVRR